jgi:Mor family transcriptional regulator
MSYRKAQDVLPQELLIIIQDFIDGEYIYIPRKETLRKKWGETTNTKEELAERNALIWNDFLQGIPMDNLSQKYYLAPKTIQKIIAKMKAIRE